MQVVSCDGYRILREKRLKERKSNLGGLMSEKLEAVWSLTNKSLQFENNISEGGPGYFDQTNVGDKRKKEPTHWKWLPKGFSNMPKRIRRKPFSHVEPLANEDQHLGS